MIFTHFVQSSLVNAIYSQKQGHIAKLNLNINLDLRLALISIPPATPPTHPTKKIVSASLYPKT